MSGTNKDEKPTDEYVSWEVFKSKCKSLSEEDVDIRRTGAATVYFG